MNVGPGRRRTVLVSNRWGIAALACLAVGALLLFLAWYDVSGTADLYKQLPYLVSAGFSGLALIVVGSALLVAGRADRVERRIAQLIDAISDAAGPPAEPGAPADSAADTAYTVAGGTTYHRAGCLLLRDKETQVIDEPAAAGLQPCPVCHP